LANTQLIVNEKKKRTKKPKLSFKIPSSLLATRCIAFHYTTPTRNTLDYLLHYKNIIETLDKKNFQDFWIREEEIRAAC
jgi:hypothetical protein